MNKDIEVICIHSGVVIYTFKVSIAQIQINASLSGILSLSILSILIMNNVLGGKGHSRCCLDVPYHSDDLG